MTLTALEELTEFIAAQKAAMAQAQSELAALTNMWQQSAKQSEVVGYQNAIAAANACIAQINAWKSAGKTTVYVHYDGHGIPSVSCNMSIG